MHIALISYHFMNVTAAGQSAAKVARALADSGHRITVFCADNNWLEGDRLMPTEGPLRGLTIQRIAADGARIPRWRRALAERDGSSWLWNRLAALPNLLRGADALQWSWVVDAVSRVDTCCREDRFDLMLTRLNHFLSHYVGLGVRRRRPRLPWVAYFSDPWPFQHYPPPYRSTAGRLLRWRLDQRLDRILHRADALIFPSRHQRDHQLQGRRRRYRGKSVIAPHIGRVWESDLKRPTSEGQPPAAARTEIGDHRPASLRILHAGFLMAERRTDALLEGLRQLVSRRPDLGAALRVEFVGRYAGNTVPSPPSDLEGIVRYHRFERPEDIGGWLQRADVLLLVEADMELGIFFPSKLADYLGARRPILALSPRRGVAADLLGNGDGDGARLLAPPDDAEAIMRSLEAAGDAWQRGHLDELLPPAASRRLVEPEQVVGRYLEAFALAMGGAKAMGADP